MSIVNGKAKRASRRAAARKRVTEYFTCKWESDPVGLLAAEIVIHAIADWRELIKEKAWLEETYNSKRNFAELRVFFKSQWCDFLMTKFSVEPEGILQLLEKELAEAMLIEMKRSGDNERV